MHPQMLIKPLNSLFLSTLGISAMCSWPQRRHPPKGLQRLRPKGLLIVLPLAALPGPTGADLPILGA